MKKVLLGILCFAMGTMAFGQGVQRVEQESSVTPIPNKALVTKDLKAKVERYNKKEEVSGWYNWMSAATTALGYESINDVFTFYNNLSMFPDSSVMMAYSAETAGPAYIHGIGMVFDPKSEYFEDPDNTGTRALSRYSKYRWDSVALFYTGYHHVVPGSVDTLIFQFYTSKNRVVIKDKFTDSEEETAYVRYDYKKNLGVGAVYTYTYYLTEKDTATNVFSTITVPTNGADGIALTSDQIAAFTVSYRPGFSYALGDTIDERFNPTKQLNHFRPAIGRDESKAPGESYNNGLRLTTATRYNKTGNSWNGAFIPGDAWNDNNEYLLSSFYISSSNVGIEEDAAFKGYSVSNIYPNPASGIANLNFELAKTENVTISLYNVVGQKVSTIAEGKYAAGKHNVNFSVDNLNAGVYFYTINAGGFTKTMKFTVAK